VVVETLELITEQPTPVVVEVEEIGQIMVTFQTKPEEMGVRV
jgi:hypothetical protein